MVKIVSEFAQPTKQDGTPVDIAPQAQEADPRAFQLIPTGFYPAIIQGISAKSYYAKWGEHKNPDAAKNAADKGKWEYHALTPDVFLLNADTNGVNSRITRQDVTLGVLWRGQWYRPDGSKEAPFFKDGMNLLASVSMFQIVNGVATINGDTDWIIERPSKVSISHAGYVAGKNINLNPKQLTTEFTRLNGDDAGYTDEDLGRLIEEFNLEKGYIDQNGEQIEFVYTDKYGAELDEPIPVRLKLKNYISGWYFPSNVDIRINNWITRNGKVFLSEAHADSYERIVTASGAANEENQDF